MVTNEINKIHSSVIEPQQLLMTMTEKMEKTFLVQEEFLSVYIYESNMKDKVILKILGQSLNLNFDEL